MTRDEVHRRIHCALCFFGVPFLVSASRRMKACWREGMADWREGNDAKRQ